MSNFICRYSHYPFIHCMVFGLLIVGFLLSGCNAIRPNQEVPGINNTIRISEVVSSDLRFCQTVSDQWWTIFNDPLLSSFICRAEQKSLDLKIILARLKEARATQGAGPFYFSPTVDASWEIDLLDRLLSSTETATADYQASWEDYKNMLVTVRAEVANVYLQIRTQQARLNTAENNVTLLQSFVKLTNVQYQNGLTSYFDVAQAKHSLALAELEAPAIRIELEQSITRLGVLLGESSDNLQKDLYSVHLVSLPSPILTVKIPADRLRQRPDIRTAERKLAARITSDHNATDDGYPSLSLTGKIEASSLNPESSNLDLDSPVPEFRSLFHWDIFNLDRTGERIKAKDDRAEPALSAYQLSLRKARTEVADRLNGYHEQKLRLEMVNKSVQTLEERLDMSTQLYKDGQTNFQNLLDAQRSLFVAANDLDVARGRTGIQLVGLYKALAGGWGNFDQDDRQSNSGDRKIVESLAPFTLDGKQEDGV